MNAVGGFNPAVANLQSLTNISAVSGWAASKVAGTKTKPLPKYAPIQAYETAFPKPQTGQGIVQQKPKAQYQDQSLLEILQPMISNPQ